MTERTDAPGPLKRRGPRPLLLHLTLAMLRSSGCPDGWPNWNSGSPSWSEAAGAGCVAALLRGAVEALAPSDSAAAYRRMQQETVLLAGIAAYRRHPWARNLPDPPEVWREGGSRMLDYGGTGPAMLVVPSLVNRAYVLDLMPDHSLLRWLAAHGVRPLLLDWGWPGALERRFTLTDYVAGRLERALLAATGLANGPVLVVGYCMGGTLAVAAAQRRPELVRALVLLATPWDFHAADALQARLTARLVPRLEPLMRAGGTLPVDALQMLFALLDPGGVAEKFRAFARLDQDSARARLFVALEDWLNDGVPLAAPVARECLAGWYGENSPATGAWQIAGLAVDPRRLRMPTLVMAPGRDRIVPPESARALAGLIEGAILHEPPMGHIGMVAGTGARQGPWETLRDWLGHIR